MKHQDDSDLDRGLRAAYEPAPEVVRQVAAGALAQRPRKPASRRMAAVLASAALLLACFVVIRNMSPVPPETFQLEYVGGVAVLEYPDGSSWLVTPDTAAESASAGLNLILIGGEQP